MYMNMFNTKLRGFLTKIFAISLLMPIVAFVVFFGVGTALLYFAPEIADSTDFYLVFLFVVGLIAVLILPFLTLEYYCFGSLGVFVVEMLENSLDTALKTDEILIFITSIVFLAIPLIGMRFLLKKPLLYRIMVYVPLIISIYLSLEHLYISDKVNLILCIKDGIYLILGVILDLSCIKARCSA